MAVVESLSGGCGLVKEKCGWTRSRSSGRRVLEKRPLSGQEHAKPEMNTLKRSADRGICGGSRCTRATPPWANPRCLICQHLLESIPPVLYIKHTLFFFASGQFGTLGSRLFSHCTQPTHYTMELGSLNKAQWVCTMRALLHTVNRKLHLLRENAYLFH